MKLKALIILGLMMLMMTSAVSALASYAETLPVGYVSYDMAVLRGNVTNVDGPSALAYFEYRENDSIVWIETTKNPAIAEVTSTGEYSYNVTGLNQNTTYVYRAVIDDGVVTEDINTENFTTNSSPVIDNPGTTDTTTDSFVFTYNVSDLGEEDNITTYAECYGDDGSNFSTNETAEIINTTGEVSILIDDLESDTVYTCRGVVEFEYDGATEYVYTDSVTTTTENETIREGVNNTRNTIFVAFALLALIILSTIVFLIISSLGGGVDTTQFMMVAIWAIGGAILILIGYIVISAIAGGVMRGIIL